MAKKRTVSRRSRAARPRVSARETFNPDYTYVIQDLRRIALLAGSFIVVLIALSFVLK